MDEDLDGWSGNSCDCKKMNMDKKRNELIVILMQLDHEQWCLQSQDIRVAGHSQPKQLKPKLTQ